jgi:hypothetical protein
VVRNLKVFDLSFFYVRFSKFARRSENFDYSFSRESCNLGDARKVFHEALFVYSRVLKTFVFGFTEKKAFERVECQNKCC